MVNIISDTEVPLPLVRYQRSIDADNARPTVKRPVERIVNGAVRKLTFYIRSFSGEPDEDVHSFLTLV